MPMILFYFLSRGAMVELQYISRGPGPHSRHDRHLCGGGRVRRETL